MFNCDYIITCNGSLPLLHFQAFTLFIGSDSSASDTNQKALWNRLAPWTVGPGWRGPVSVHLTLALADFSFLFLFEEKASKCWWGRQVGKRTRKLYWPMEDERWYKHTSAFDIRSSSGKRRKIDNNRRKKEAEKRTDEKEATKLNQKKFQQRIRNLKWRHSNDE